MKNIINNLTRLILCSFFVGLIGTANYLDANPRVHEMEIGDVLEQVEAIFIHRHLVKRKPATKKLFVAGIA